MPLHLSARVTAFFLASLAGMAHAQPAPPDSPGHSQESGTLAEVSVSGQNEAGTGYAGKRRQTAATRTDTPLIETPQSVRVISQPFMQELGATQLDDVVDYVSGVSRLNDFGGAWDNYAIRGFSNTDGGSLLNGFASSRGYGPRRDAASIERIEFLKGPASALYGSSEPGGTLNVVTKKPQFIPALRMQAQAGTKGFGRVTLDATGPLGQGAGAHRFAYRLNAAAEDSASRTTLVNSRKYVIAPAFTWVIGADTVLNYEAEFIRARTPLDRGLILVNGNPQALPDSRYLGEPGTPNMRQSGNTHQLTLERHFSPGWRWRVGASHRRTGREGWAAELIGALQRDGRTLTRRNSWRSLPARDASVQVEVEGKLRTGHIGHTMLAGLEAAHLHTETDLAYSNLQAWPYAIDIHAPVYGQPAAPVVRSTAQTDRQRATGFFVQDQLDLNDKWKLLLGLRADRFRQEQTNRLRSRTQTQRHSAISPRAGITYMLTPDSSVYVSYGRSFRPNSGVNARGAAFEPQKGAVWEAGLKWQTPDQRLAASVAAFDIRKTNVLTRDPHDANFSIATGRVRSRGLEADAAGSITPHWRLSANLAWMNTKVDRDNNPALQGKRLAGIPRVSGSLLLMHESALPGGSRYGVGGGLTHVGQRTGNATDSYRLAGYTIVSLHAWWQITPAARLRLDALNLFDKRYTAASWSSMAVLPGMRRRFIAGVQMSF